MAFVADAARHRGHARARAPARRLAARGRAGRPRARRSDPQRAPARPPHAHREGGRGRTHRRPARGQRPASGRRPHLPRPHAARATSARPRSASTDRSSGALARETDALIAVCPEVRDELVEIGVAPASHFAVVRLGIELSERMAGAERGEALRAELGIPAERFTVGWVGRMTAVKQAQDVLRTVRLAARPRAWTRRSSWSATAPTAPSSRSSRASSASRTPTHFVGFQDDVGPWFHAFDALLLPSRSEGTPVSAIETLAVRPAGRRHPRRRRPGRRRRRNRRLPLPLRRRGRGRRAPRRASPPTPRSATGWASRAASGRCGATACRGSWTTSTASTGHCSPRSSPSRPTGLRRARRGSRSSRACAASRAAALPPTTPTRRTRAPRPRGGFPQP